MTHKKIILWGIGGAVVAVLVCLGIAYVILGFVAGRELAAAQLAVKAAGYPTKMSDFVLPTVADEDNAAILYESAHHRLEAAGWEKLAEKIDDYTQLSAAEQSQVAIFLQQKNVQQSLVLLQEASAKPACQFINDFSAGPYTLMPHISWNIFPFLVAKFQVDVAQNNYAQALQALRLNIDYNRRIYQDPYIISFMVMRNNFMLIYKQIQQLTTTGYPIPSSILDDVTNANMRTALIRALNGERVIPTGWIYEESLQLKWQALIATGDLGRFLNVQRWFSDFQQATDIRCSLDLLAYAQSPYAGKAFNSKHYDPESQLMRVLVDVPLIMFKSCAQLEITKAGLAVLQYQREHAAYPKELNEVGTFIDPFTEKPLLYSNSEHGFEISSLGENLDSNDKKAPRWAYTQP